MSKLTKEEIQREAERLLTTGAGGEFVQYVRAVLAAGDRGEYGEVMGRVWMLFGVGLFCAEKPRDEWPAPEAVSVAVGILRDALAEMASLETMAANVNMERNRN